MSNKMSIFGLVVWLNHHTAHDALEALKQIKERRAGGGGEHCRCWCVVEPCTAWTRRRVGRGADAETHPRAAGEQRVVWWRWRGACLGGAGGCIRARWGNRGRGGCGQRGHSGGRWDPAAACRGSGGRPSQADACSGARLLLHGRSLLALLQFRMGPKGKRNAKWKNPREDRNLEGMKLAIRIGSGRDTRTCTAWAVPVSSPSSNAPETGYPQRARWIQILQKTP